MAPQGGRAAAVARVHQGGAVGVPVGVGVEVPVVHDLARPTADGQQPQRVERPERHGLRVRRQHRARDPLHGVLRARGHVPLRAPVLVRPVLDGRVERHRGLRAGGQVAGAQAAVGGVEDRARRHPLDREAEQVLVPRHDPAVDHEVGLRAAQPRVAQPAVGREARPEQPGGAAACRPRGRRRRSRCRRPCTPRGCRRATSSARPRRSRCWSAGSACRWPGRAATGCSCRRRRW